MMDFDEWFDTYNPIANTSSWATTPYVQLPGSNQELAYGFETFGDDLDTVINTQRVNPCNVWTVRKVDGRLVLVPGYYLVGVFCYLLTKNKWSDESVEIAMDINI